MHEGLESDTHLQRHHVGCCWLASQTLARASFISCNCTTTRPISQQLQESFGNVILRSSAEVKGLLQNKIYKVLARISIQSTIKEEGCL